MSAVDLPELRELDALAQLAGDALERRTLCEVAFDGQHLPVDAFLLGSADPRKPAIAFVGGVHGLERIGAELVVACLRSVVMRLRWDETLHRQLESMRMLTHLEPDKTKLLQILLVGQPELLKRLRSHVYR